MSTLATLAMLVIVGGGFAEEQKPRQPAEAQRPALIRARQAATEAALEGGSQRLPVESGPMQIIEDCREGPVSYMRTQWSGHPVYFRAEPSQRQLASGPHDVDRDFPELDERSRNIDVLVWRITEKWLYDRPSSDEVIWMRFRRLWNWGKSNIRQDIDELSRLSGDRGGRPSISDMTLAERRLGYVPTGTCYATAHTYATLMARIGIPRDRFAIATAYYGETASHVYLALYISDEWYYFDPSFVRSAPELPITLSNIQSVGSVDLGVDYPHPISLRFPGEDPLHERLPLLKPAPDYTWRVAEQRAAEASESTDGQGGTSRPEDSQTVSASSETED